MQVDSAIRLVNEIKFFPGWHFEATDHCNRFEDSITVTITYPSWETNREQALTGRDLANNPHATFPLMVGMIKDDIELYRVLMHVIAEINSHEAREAFRVEPTKWDHSTRIRPVVLCSGSIPKVSVRITANTFPTCISG